MRNGYCQNFPLDRRKIRVYFALLLLVDPLNGFGRLLLHYMDPHVMWQWLALALISKTTTIGLNQFCPAFEWPISRMFIGTAANPVLLLHTITD